MTFSENRYPLFGIMLLSTASPPRQPLISRAARGRRYGRAHPNLQIFKRRQQAGGERRVTGVCAAGTGAYGSSEISLLYSASDQARTVRVRTLPMAPIAMQNLAMLSPLADSTMVMKSWSPLVR